MPKYNITKEEFDALPGDRQGDYRELHNSPGKYRLHLDDNPVSEFRETNITLANRLEAAVAEAATAKAAKEATDAVLARYRDEDGNPLDADDLKRIKAELSNKGGKPNASVADAIAAALQPLKTQLETVTSALEAQKNQTKAEREKAERASLESELRRVAEPLLEPSIVGDVVRLMIDDGLYGYDSEARSVKPNRRDSEGNDLTPERYFDGLRKSKPVYFKASGLPKDDRGRQEGRSHEKDPGGVLILRNPDALEKGRYAKEIANGTARVVRDK